MGLLQCDKTPEMYALQVHGDSMLPEFENGDIIIVDPGISPASKDYVVTDYNGDISLSQYIIKEDKVFLIPTHHDYPAQEWTKDHRHKGVVAQKKRRKHKLVRYDL